MLPTFHIRTYGCQMNERDSEAVACLLENRGFQAAASEAEADVLLFNTCSVRDQAEQKAIGKVGLMKRLKRERPHLVIGVLGCMAQRLGEALPERLPHVDLVVGTDQLPRLPELLLDLLAHRRPGVYTDRTTDGLEMLGLHAPGKISAFVAVMRGCNMGCSYCIVPETRGREASRAIPDIVAEVTRLVAGGTREIMLLGQNVTAYGVSELRKAGTYTPDQSPFADLLRAVSAVPGLRRLRFTSPHPQFMNAAFVQALADCPQICDSFHIPLQSGADSILQAMKRTYTADEYRARIAAIRAVRPAATFSTDIIVGFPGEGEAEFAATRELMAEIGFDMAYVFRYSPRPGTLADRRLADSVPPAVKEERLQLLLADLAARVLRQNQARVGQTVEIMLEGPSPRNPERWCGRDCGNKMVIVPPAPEYVPGQFLAVRVTRATAHSLFAEPV